MSSNGPVSQPVSGTHVIMQNAAAAGVSPTVSSPSTQGATNQWPGGVVGKSDIPKSVPGNFMALIDKIDVRFRFNERNDEHEVYVPKNLERPPMIAGWQRLSDEGLRYLADTATKHCGQTFKIEVIDQGAMTLGDQSKYDPVRDRFERLKGSWDGVPRVRKFLAAYCKADDNILNEQYSLLFFVGLVMRIYFPGSKFDFCLVLIGAEGAGKSSIGRKIVGDEYFTDQLKIGSDPRTIIEQTAGVAIAEFSELGGYRDSIQEQIKAMLSTQIDIAREVWNRKATRKMRSSIFYATTNKLQPLKGVDGNRRFGPVEVGEIDLVALDRDIDQILAEAINLFFSEFKGNPDNVGLDPKYYAAAKQRQEEHTEGTLWEPKIQANIRVILDRGIRKFNSSGLDEIFVASADIQQIVHPAGSLRGADGKYLKEAMIALGWREDRNGKERTRGYKKILTAAELAQLNVNQQAKIHPLQTLKLPPLPLPPTVQ